MHHLVRVVPAFTRAKRFQLRFGVLGVLSCEARVLRRQTGPARAVAGSTRRKALGHVAAAPDFSTERERVLVFQHARHGTLRGVIRRHIAHVSGGEVGNHAAHDRVFPLGPVFCSGLEIGELLLQVFGHLAGQLRIGGSRAVAVGTVASRANLVGDALALGGISFGRGLRGGKRAGANRKAQKRQRSFHAFFPPRAFAQKADILAKPVAPTHVTLPQCLLLQKRCLASGRSGERR